MRKEPRILIVSNNPFSSTQNNGKTLDSFFQIFNAKNISQLYFSSEVPSGISGNSFFRITDKDIISSLKNKEYKCGNKIFKLNGTKLKNKKIKNSKLRKSNILRIVREIVWRTEKWKTNELDNWLNEIQPDIIFFCAGDSGFAYDIVTYIQNKVNSKLAVYITDDYILPRKNLNIFWWIRRAYIFYKMKKCLKNSNIFFTISEKMQKTYKKIFKKESYLVMNITDNLKDNERLKVDSKKNREIIYTGGLHFNRDKSLELLAKNLKKFNEKRSEDKKYILKIFSTQELSETQKNKLNIKNTSFFCGGLTKEELKEKLNNAFMVVHVESFDKKSIESTRLSISTKIPEYLSLEKPILAIGPKNIASIEYLEEVAYSIYEEKKFLEKLTYFLENENFQNELSKKSYNKFLELHQKEKTLKNFKNNLINLNEVKCGYK